MISTMVKSNSPTATVTHGGKTYRVDTLNGLIKKGTATTIDGNPLSGSDLEKFRTSWISEFDNYVAPSRNSMNITLSGGKTINTYLAHVVSRNKAKLAMIETSPV
jgi:hypothetical protein